MAIVSFDIGVKGKNAPQKGVMLVKKQGVYHLLKTVSEYPAEMDSYARYHDLRLSQLYLDVVTETYPLPPVKGEKTIRLLLENRLREQLRVQDTFLFSYNEDTTKSTAGKKQYRVTALPEQVFERDLGLKESTRQHTSLYTLSRFSLAGISARFNKRGAIFHAFADDEKIIMTMSIGQHVEFSRTTLVEAPFETDEDRQNFYNENINLTYMYVRQVRPQGVDFVLLSGKLAFLPELHEKVERFTGVTPRILKPERFVKGCSFAVFHEHFLAISNVFLPEQFNMLPARYREEKNYRSVLMVLNMVLFLFASYLLFDGVSRYEEADSSRLRAGTLARSLSSKYIELTKRLEYVGLVQYQYRYVETLDNRNGSPVTLLIPLEELMSEIPFTTLEFSPVKGGGSFASLTGSRTFTSLAEMDGQRARIARMVERIRQDKMLTIEDKGKEFPNDMKVNYHFVVRRKGGA